MTHQLNTWSSPEVAKTWPEGSKVAWRIKPFMLGGNMQHHYGNNEWHCPDLIGKEYPFNQPKQEFMLLELPK